MRNLKKILSLALALVMVMSLLTVASAKDFNDADQIEHTEAVEVMTSLGVIEGMGGNTFAPNQPVTRAQMAKMITYISLGNVEPDAFTGTTTNLTDVDGHWGEAYIKYCYSQGIISGRGNGIFDPNSSVTATEAARMLLVAIGYNADVQIYTGSQWAINVVRDAQLSRLYDNVSVTSTEVLTRDKAAQMLYNALNAKTIVKSSQVDRVTGDITDIYTANGPTLLYKSYDAKVAIATFAGNNSFRLSGSGTPLKGEITVINGDIENDNRVVVPASPAFATASFPFDFDIANVGEQVKVIFKDGTTGTPYVPDRNDTIFGVYKTNATTVITATMNDVKELKSTAVQIDIGGTRYDTADDVDVYYNFTPSGTTLSYESLTSGAAVVSGSKDADDGTSTSASTLTKALRAANGNVVKAVVNDSTGLIDKIFVTTTRIAAVTAVNSEKVSMNNGVGAITIADGDVYDGIARGDVVNVTSLYKANAYDDDAYNIITKAEVLSGTVTGFKDTENIVLDGTTYKVYNKATMLSNIPNASNIINDFTSVSRDKTINESFDLYMVNGYVGAAVQTSQAANNYSVVIAKDTGTTIGGTFNAQQIQVMDATGAKTILTVSSDSRDESVIPSTSVGLSTIKLGDIVVWSGSAGDATVNIKAHSAPASTEAYKDTTKAFAGTVTSNDCVLFATTEAGGLPSAKVKAYNIRNLRDFTVTVGQDVTYYTDPDTSRVVAVFVDMAHTPGGAAGSTVYGIVSSHVGRRNVNGDYYQQYIVEGNGGRYVINTPNLGVIAKGQLVRFDVATDEIYSAGDLTILDAATPDMTAVYVDEFLESDGVLTYFTAKTGTAGNYAGDPATRKTVSLDKDCVIVYVDADNDCQGSEIGIDMFSAITGYKNVAIITDPDDSNLVVAILVETSGKANIMAAGDIMPSGYDAYDVGEQLKEHGNVTLTDGIPEGEFSGVNGGDATITVQGGTVSGEATVKGEVVVDGDVSVGASGTLSVQEITVKAGSTFVVTDGATLTTSVLNIESGAKVQWGAGIVFTYKADFVIDFINKQTIVDGYVFSNFATINGDDAGFLSAMYATDGNGEDAGDNGYFTQKVPS